MMFNSFIHVMSHKGQNCFFRIPFELPGKNRIRHNHHTQPAHPPSHQSQLAHKPSVESENTVLLYNRGYWCIQPKKIQHLYTKRITRHRHTTTRAGTPLNAVVSSLPPPPHLKSLQCVSSPGKS